MKKCEKMMNVFLAVTEETFYLKQCQLEQLLIKQGKKGFQIILPSDVIIAVEHMVPGSLQKLPICFCFHAERQNAAEK